MPMVKPLGRPECKMPTKDVLLEAARALMARSPLGFGEPELTSWLDEHYPRADGRSWEGNLMIVADFAVWADNGEFCSTADNVTSYPKFLERITPRDQHQHMRYRWKADAHAVS